MQLNTAIKERLREYNIPVDDGINFLLGIYYGHISEYFPLVFKLRIMATKIYEGDPKASNTIKWNIPLFDDQVTGYEWVSGWMDMFGEINPDRRGTKSFVMSRMKKFFVENPTVRVDDIMGATKMYFRNVDNAKFLKSSHKFIMEGKGADRYSLLLEWVEKYQNWQKADKERNSISNTMQ